MKRKRPGFTLLELLVGGAIMSVVAYGASMTVSSTFTSTRQANDKMTALLQVQNTGYWLSRDLIEAQNILPGDATETPQSEILTLVWTNWEDATTQFVYYYTEEMQDGLKRLRRHNIVKNESQVVVSDATILVAENILPPTTISQIGDMWRVVIQARVRLETQTKEYNIFPRPNA